MPRMPVEKSSGNDCAFALQSPDRFPLGGLPNDELHFANTAFRNLHIRWILTGYAGRSSKGKYYRGRSEIASLDGFIVGRTGIDLRTKSSGKGDCWTVFQTPLGIRGRAKT